LRHFKPLPSLPSHPPPMLNVFNSQATLIVPQGMARPESGYELCSGCLELAGVHHAIEAGLSPGSASPSISPSSADDAQRALEWRRLAPKKGQTRHAYQEKVWGHLGWEDVGTCIPFQYSCCSLIHCLQSKTNTRHISVPRVRQSQRTIATSARRV
jgi:hypothetical protein